MIFFILLIFATNILAQEDFCVKAALETQDLLKNYKFSEMEKKLEEVISTCPIEKYINLHHQLAMVYIWKEKFDKAKPIVEKITKEIEYKQAQVPSSLQLGKGRILNVMYANYTNDNKSIDKELSDFDNLNFKSQEAVLFYLLRKNDKRFMQYYGIRRQVKGDLAPLLCQVYCKKNNIIKDCPCTEKVDKKFEGGIYLILQEYLDGTDLKVLKEKIEKNYKDAPGIKKEIFEILNIN